MKDDQSAANARASLVNNGGGRTGGLVPMGIELAERVRVTAERNGDDRYGREPLDGAPVAAVAIVRRRCEADLAPINGSAPGIFRDAGNVGRNSSQVARAGCRHQECVPLWGPGSLTQAEFAIRDRRWTRVLGPGSSRRRWQGCSVHLPEDVQPEHWAHARRGCV